MFCLEAECGPQHEGSVNGLVTLLCSDNNNNNNKRQTEQAA